MIRTVQGMVFLVLVLLPAPALPDTARSEGDRTRLTVRLSEYRFEPARVFLKSGEPVELFLVNEGTVLHEFVSGALAGLTVALETGGVIAEVSGLEELEIAPGAEVRLRFTPKVGGEFPFACEAVQPEDHLLRGMSGRILVQ